jgi:hypothetical protein
MGGRLVGWLGGWEGGREGGREVQSLGSHSREKEESKGLGQYEKGGMASREGGREEGREAGEEETYREEVVVVLRAYEGVFVHHVHGGHPQRAWQGGQEGRHEGGRA